MKKLRGFLPIIVSAALIGWMLTVVSPSALAAEAGKLDWHLLVPATVAAVLALYLWDAVCLQTIYGLPDHPITWRQALHLRGTSYLAGALNYELGQGVLAWGVANRQQVSLLSALSRSVALAWHDVVVLLSLGLFGATLANTPEVSPIRSFCIVGLAIFLGLGVVPFLLNERSRRRLRQTRWGAWLETWSFSRTVRLAIQRVGYFVILVVYGAAALAICKIPVDHLMVLSTVPLMLLADGLPSVGGLGTRDATLKLLLNPPDPAPLMAMTQVWTWGMVFGRVAIGLGHLWIPRICGLTTILSSENPTPSAPPTDE